VARRWLGIGSALVLVGAGALLWWSRGVHPDEAPITGAATPAPVPSAQPTPAPPVPPPPGDAAPEPEYDADEWSEPKPTLGMRPAHARKSYDTREASPEELAKLGPELDKYYKAWEQYMSPLLYPPGHPQEGEYRDNVCLEQAVEAQLEYFAATNPAGSLDRPGLHVRRHVRYEVARDAQRGWNPEDLASTRALYDKLMAAPEDPRAPLADIWLPAAPGDREATTRREFLEGRLRRREAPIFRKRGCSDAG